MSDSQGLTWTLQASSSPLRGVATRPPGKADNAGVLSSSPLRGAATALAARRAPSVRGHHRPYEGQQHDEVTLGERPGARSSPPYEGQQPARPGPYTPAPHAGHHRPYEGQQQEHPDGTLVLTPAGHHRPHEGQQLGPQDDPGDVPCRRHHRPYEGQQHEQICQEWLSHLPVIIAPTRGSNMSRMACTMWLWSHHRPYEGQQLAGQDSQDVGVAGHHRPYEGQQHEVTCWLSLAAEVIVAPTRGSNGVRAGAAVAEFVRSSSPLRGAARLRICSHVHAPCRSSSPLRGAATCRLLTGNSLGQILSSSPLRGAAT